MCREEGGVFYFWQVTTATWSFHWNFFDHADEIDRVKTSCIFHSFNNFAHISIPPNVTELFIILQLSVICKGCVLV